jgi:uncharacterized protein (DUF1501 family)
MNRRQFISGVSGGLLGLLGARLAPSRARAAAAHAQAKACIVLWLNGGPSHLDTWDPKPGAATGGPFKAIATSAPAIQICEHLPQVAEQAHHLAILRGMTSREGNHDRAQHLLHTGYVPNPTVSFPSLGGWVSAELGAPDAELPNFVSIGGPSASAGFLGVQNGPFVVANPSQPIANTSYPRNLDFVRFLRRKAALEQLESQFAVETGDAKVKGRQAVYAKAVRMMYAPRLRAFEIADEPDAVKAAYGDSDFGRGCLMARRLVEAGVKLVEVVLDGWDTHQNNFERTKKLMGALDPAMATLVRDLGERKLLGSTLILCLGEFGRTPKINDSDGRDHFPAAWSAVLAGGGVRGGVVHGATSGEGDRVVSAQTVVPDLFATAATLLGMDPDKTVTTPLGRPVSLTDSGKAIHEILV